MRERRHSSETRKLERLELAKLQQASATDPVPPTVTAEGSAGGRRAAGSQPPATRPAANIVEDELPIRARAETLHDPMTMALLAEVARTAPTPELDADAVDPAGFDTPALNESIHPHVLRR